VHNKGGRVFVMKWGITKDDFFRHYLAKLRNTPSSQLVEKHANLFPRASLIGKLRRAGYGLFYDYPLQGIEKLDAFSCHNEWTTLA
jgi:hypothetical protein